jgi:hypothetical protein
LITFQNSGFLQSIRYPKKGILEIPLPELSGIPASSRFRITYQPLLDFRSAR